MDDYERLVIIRWGVGGEGAGTNLIDLLENCCEQRYYYYYYYYLPVFWVMTMYCVRCLPFLWVDTNVLGVYRSFGL
jgi:hypothetical protein